MSTGAIEVKPADALATYDPTQEEPNFAISIECIRQTGARWPHSRWRIGGQVEDKPFAAMARKPRDYVAAVLRHIAAMVNDEPDIRTPPRQRAIQEARGRYLDARLALTELTDIIRHLIEIEHLTAGDVASELRLKQNQVERIVRGGYGELLYQLPAVPQRDYGGVNPKGRAFKAVYGLERKRAEKALS